MPVAIAITRGGAGLSTVSSTANATMQTNTPRPGSSRADLNSTDLGSLIGFSSATGKVLLFCLSGSQAQVLSFTKVCANTKSTMGHASEFEPLRSPVGHRTTLLRPRAGTSALCPRRIAIRHSLRHVEPAALPGPDRYRYQLSLVRLPLLAHQDNWRYETTHLNALGLILKYSRSHRL